MSICVTFLSQSWEEKAQYKNCPVANGLFNAYTHVHLQGIVRYSVRIRLTFILDEVAKVNDALVNVCDIFLVLYLWHQRYVL